MDETYDPGMDEVSGGTSFDPSTYGSSAAMYQSYPNVPASGVPTQTPANTQAMGPAAAGQLATAQPNYMVYILAALVVYYLMKKKG